MKKTIKGKPGDIYYQAIKTIRDDLKKTNSDEIINFGGVKITKDTKFKEKLTEEEVMETLNECYDDIKKLLKKYLDLKEEYYDIITLWIIGTYFHDEFESYPYLFFNAMRGSGKSRTLRLVSKLCNGNVMASPTEAVLFRTTGTLGIDEFEGVANKDKSSIRELLNGAYKKGIKICRMKKKKGISGEEQVVEEFEVYRPITMANIWGMEEVLSDRCISLILEKSDDPAKTRLIEDFENNNYIQKINNSLSKCSLCSVVTKKNIHQEWNNYISDRYETTSNALTTNTTYTTLTTLFNKIHDSKIIGRNLELFIPLFFISNFINKDYLEKIIEIAKDVTDKKKKEEETESIDVMVFDFVSKREGGMVWYSIKDLTNEFRQFADENSDWLNNKWFGRALKRLNLIVDKRRKGYGMEVMLNPTKALKKLNIFKKEE